MLYLKVIPQFLLTIDKSLSFNVFYFNPFTRLKGIALAKGDLLDKDRLLKVREMVDKGYHLEVREEDLDKITDQGINLSQILVNVEKVLTQRKSEIEAREMLSKKEKPNYLELFKGCVLRDNFDPILEIVKLEIATYSSETSYYQTQLKSFLIKALARQTYLTSGACFLFLLLKKLKRVDELEVLEVLTACFLKDIGISQIPFEVRFKEQDEHYQKHPMFSVYFLGKFGFEPSVQLKRYILEHQELSDGSGFPRQKNQNQLHTNSLLLGMVDFIFYSNHLNKQRRIPKIIEGLDENLYLSEHIGIAKSFL
jgi:HD-GYP domain-containing protein (c-di-GMP phosphodiesterase class II)